jgi:hypothetical protein
MVVPYNPSKARRSAQRMAAKKMEAKKARARLLATPRYRFLAQVQKVLGTDRKTAKIVTRAAVRAMYVPNTLANDTEVRLVRAYFRTRLPILRKLIKPGERLPPDHVLCPPQPRPYEGVRPINHVVLPFDPMCVLTPNEHWAGKGSNRKPGQV